MRVYSVFFKLFTFMYTYDIICRNLLTKSFNFNKEKIIFIINLKEGFFMLKKEIMKNADMYNKLPNLTSEEQKNKVSIISQKNRENIYITLLTLSLILVILFLIFLFIPNCNLVNCILAALLSISFFMLFLTGDKSKKGLSSKWSNLGLSILWLFNFITRLF